MIRNRGLIITGLVAFVALMVVLLRHFRGGERVFQEPTEIVVETEPTIESPKPPRPAIRYSPLDDRINAPGGSAKRDLETIHVLLFQTRSSVKNLASKPMGTNTEFTAVLTGNNSERLAAIPPDHPAINDKGELTDRWGKPLFFHPESSSKTTLRSAGPDGKFFNQDDVIFPDGP